MNAVVGRCLPALLVVASATLVAAPAEARSCDQVTGLITTTAPQAGAVLTLPSALTGAAIPTDAVKVSQAGNPVPVLSWRHGDRAFTDVMVVVDTSAAAAASIDVTRRVLTAFLTALPAATSVGVLSAGDSPGVVRERAPGPVDAAVVGATLVPAGAGPGVLRDAVKSALDDLPASAVRSQHVVLIGGGTDVSSTTTWDDLQVRLAARGVALDVIDAGAAPSLPEALPQCPSGPAAADPEGFGRSVATAIADSRRLTLGPIGAGAVSVTVTVGEVTAAGQLLRRGPVSGTQAAVPTAPRSASTVDGSTLLQSLLLGLVGLLLLVVVLNLLTGRGSAVRRTVHEIAWTVRAQYAERGAPDERRRAPRAELQRIRADAWQDLLAVWGDAPSSREVAERAARDEDRARTAAWEHEQAEAERLVGRERAAGRRDRAYRRALELMALERADREHLRLAQGDVGADRVQPSDWVEDGTLAAPDIVIPAYRAKLVAENRKADAARAAAAAIVQAQEAEEAAARARAARQEAEQAAQAARSSAASDRLATADAVTRRRLAEEEAAAAAAEAVAAEALADEARLARQAALREAAAGGSRPTGAGPRTPAKRAARKRPAAKPAAGPARDDRATPGTGASNGSPASPAPDDDVIDLRPTGAPRTGTPGSAEAVLALHAPRTRVTMSIAPSVTQPVAPPGAPGAASVVSRAPTRLSSETHPPTPAAALAVPAVAIAAGHHASLSAVRAAPVLVLVALLGRPLVHPDVWLGTSSAPRLVVLLLGVLTAVSGVRLLRAAARPAAVRPVHLERTAGLAAAAAEAVRRLHAADWDPATTWADFESTTGVVVPPDLRDLIGFRPDADALLHHLALEEPAAPPAGSRPDGRAGLVLVLLGASAVLLV